MIDVSEAFTDFLVEATLRRKSIGSRDNNGNWVEGIITSNTINVVAQSLTADERLALPEAVRSRETFKFHTTTPIQTADETTQINADIIEYGGKRWEINQVFDRACIGGYFKAIGVKI